MAAPPDLSRCHRCGRPVPPANNPGFADWVVAKDDAGKVLGMRCPACQAAEGSLPAESPEGAGRQQPG